MFQSKFEFFVEIVILQVKYGISASEMKLLRIVNEIKVSKYLENVDLAKYQACNGKWMELQMTGNILTTS